MVFIAKFKTHIIYGAGIIILCIILLFSGKPKEKIVTQTETKEVIKYVDKIIIQHNDVITSRTIVQKQKDCSETTTTETIVDKTSIDEKKKIASQETQINTKTEITRYQSKYTLSVLYAFDPKKLNLLPDPLDAKVIGGMRIFSLPVLINIGTNLKLTEVTAGLTIEL